MKKNITQAAIDELAQTCCEHWRDGYSDVATGMVYAFATLTGMHLVAAMDMLNKRGKGKVNV